MALSLWFVREMWALQLRVFPRGMQGGGVAEPPPHGMGFGFGAAGGGPISWGIWRVEAAGPTMP